MLEKNLTERQEEKKREPALDVLRICAFCFVVSVHFFKNCGYYTAALLTSGMGLATCFRQFFMICVPLFMMLTGYLTGGSTPCRKYYRKLIDTLGIYVLASLCCTAYDVYMGKESLRLYQLVNSISHYEAAPYAWYVEMYIGLFLLSPFLNAGYQALGEKRKKQWLLGVLLLLTALPGVVNVYVPRVSWFMNPRSSSNYLKILPDYWNCLYPFTYYFLGSYIREYGAPISSPKALGLSIVTALVQGLYNIWRSWGDTFLWGGWQKHSSLFVVAQTVLFFVMIRNWDLTRLRQRTCRILCRLSGLCFGAYLVSYIFDDWFYARLNAAIDYIPHRFPWFPVAVLVVASSSLALSFLINTCYEAAKKGTLAILAQARKHPVE